MTILIIILGLLPGFAWLVFYLKEDLHPEPKRLIALVFLAGAVSAIVALIAEKAIPCNVSYRFQDCFARTSISPNFFSLQLIIVFALVEEICKFGAAYFAIRKSPSFNEPVEAMVYAAIAALGFATVENLGALFSMRGEAPAVLAGIIETVSFRFVGTTLLHTITSSFAGYYWAKSIRNFGSKRFLVGGILIATILHAAFNYIILTNQGLVYPLVFVVFVAFFVLGDFEELRKEKI